MRTNVFLAVIAGVLAIPTTITLVTDGSSFTRYQDVPRLFEGFTPEKIALVQLSKVQLDENGAPVKGANDQPQRDALRLQKTANGWVIGQGVQIAGAPVRKNTVVDNVLDHVESIRRDADALVVTKATDEQLADYELSDDNGLLIQCLDANNQVVAELIKGRSARDVTAGAAALRGFFVRRKEYRDVVLYEQDNWNLSLETNAWIDRQVLPPTIASELVRFKLTNPQGEVEFKKEQATDTTWSVLHGPAGHGAARQAEVDSFVSRIARAQVMNYVQALPAAGPRRDAFLATHKLTAPEFVAELATTDGTVYVISIGDKLTDKAEHHAIFSNSDFLVTVPDYVRTTFEADPNQLFDTALEVPPKPPEDGEIREDGENREDGEKQGR